MSPRGLRQGMRPPTSSRTREASHSRRKTTVKEWYAQWRGRCTDTILARNGRSGRRVCCAYSCNVALGDKQVAANMYMCMYMHMSTCHVVHMVYMYMYMYMYCTCTCTCM